MSIRRASLSGSSVGRSVKTLSLPWLSDSRCAITTQTFLTYIAPASLAGTANAPGPWVQVFASTTEESGLLYMASMQGIFTADNSLMLEIGVGPLGQEQVIVPALAFGGQNIYSYGLPLPIPVRIPAGSRVAVRVRANSTTSRQANPYFILQKVRGQSLVPTSVDTLGSSTATSHGTALTTNPYSEIVSSTARPYQALVVLPSGSTNAGVNSTVRLTLAVGPSGQEVDIGTVDFFQASGGGMTPLSSGMAVPIPIHGAYIPAGSRLSIKHNISSNPQYVEVCIIGVPIA